MAENPALFVRVSLPHGHFTVPAVTAEAGGWKVLKQDAVDRDGRPLPPKLRDVPAAATPTESEAPAPDASKE